MKKITDSEGTEIHINDIVAYTYTDDARVYRGRVYRLMNVMVEIDIGPAAYDRFRKREGSNLLIIK